MPNKADIFLDKYKQLENVVKLQYRLGETDSAMGFLMKKKSFHNIKNELDLCRETRNLLSHNPKVKGAYAVEPSEAMIELLDSIIDKIKNPLKARDVMVRRNELCCRGMNDKVREAMIVMNKENFTHVPILENDTVVGVFGENIVFSILVKEEIVSIDDNLRFSDISKYLEFVTSKNSESKGETYKFVPQNTPVGEIGDLYKAAEEANERIGMIFVTENGKQNEKILGIITAWDIAAEVDDVV